MLALLVERAGDVVTKNEILDAVWKDSTVTENAMVRVIANLRSALGDDAKEPRYVETVHTRGYRCHRAGGAPERGAGGVRSGTRGTVPGDAATPPRGRRGDGDSPYVIAVVLAVALVRGRRRADRSGDHASGAANATVPSLAVLPLEDLGPDDQLEFADGMTEAITTQLAKIEALKVITRSAVHAVPRAPAAAAGDRPRARGVHRRGGRGIARRHPRAGHRASRGVREQPGAVGRELRG